MARAVCGGHRHRPGPHRLPLAAPAGARRLGCRRRRRGVPCPACRAGAPSPPRPLSLAHAPPAPPYLRPQQESKVWKAERHDVAEQLAQKGVSAWPPGPPPSQPGGLAASAARAGWRSSQPARRCAAAHVPCACIPPAPPATISNGRRGRATVPRSTRADPTLANPNPPLASCTTTPLWPPPQVRAHHSTVECKPALPACLPACSLTGPPCATPRPPVQVRAHHSAEEYKLTLAYFWPRVLVTSAAWGLSGFAFYGQKLLQASWVTGLWRSAAWDHAAPAGHAAPGACRLLSGGFARRPPCCASNWSLPCHAPRRRGSSR